MDNSKLKLKIGPHEFEAEGPTSVIQAQFEAFKELIAGGNLNYADSNKSVTAQAITSNGNNAYETSLNLDKITRIDERIVSLTARPETIEDAALVILLGQRTLRSN